MGRPSNREQRRRDLVAGGKADLVAARCWVSVFSEALRNAALLAQLRRLLDGEIEAIRERSGYRFTEQEAGAVLAYIVGSLVLGAFAPRKAAGFAAPGLRRLVAGIESDATRTS